MPYEDLYALHLLFLCTPFTVELSPLYFTEEEQALLERYGTWLAALWERKIPPITPNQERFCRGGKLDGPMGKLVDVWHKYLAYAPTQLTRPRFVTGLPGPDERELCPGGWRKEVRMSHKEDLPEGATFYEKLFQYMALEIEWSLEFFPDSPLEETIEEFVEDNHADLLRALLEMMYEKMGGEFFNINSVTELKDLPLPPMSTGN